jgi:glyoxylate/hydroxypyruvate reductase A
VTVLVVVNAISDNWGPERWRERFVARMPERRVALWPHDTVDPAEVRYIAAWKPPQGLIATFPQLKVVFNLGAGVDAILADRSMPAGVPLVRVATGDLTNRMSEYVLLHVLMAHRRQRELDAAQREGHWLPKEQYAAKDMRVGVMGLGVIGADAAKKLVILDFDVAGWSRSRKSIEGVRCYAGADELPAFLGRTDILVVLLPLTPDTRGILNRDLFGKLARDGKLGAPVLINAARGGHQVEADIIAALDDGTLLSATLDVFEQEPLPSGHPLWRHPKVTVTPHNAADSDADAITEYVVAQIEAFEAGKPLGNVVDRRMGY